MAETKTTTKSNDLPNDIFGVEVKDHQLLHTALRAYNANSRQVGAKTLKRGEVRGGGKKPWRQKGTGRARAGSIRSPIWRGGGITFGPTGNENYKVALPLKAKRQAIRQALSLKSKEGAVRLIPAFELKEAKTKELSTWLSEQKTKRHTLLVVDKADIKLKRASANIGHLTVLGGRYLNVYDVLRADDILITKSGLGVVKEWLGGTK